MGIGIAVMENLLVNYHVGYCIDCQEWTAFTKNLCGSFTCPMCNNFGSPGYDTKKTTKEGWTR